MRLAIWLLPDTALLRAVKLMSPFRRIVTARPLIEPTAVRAGTLESYVNVTVIPSPDAPVATASMTKVLPSGKMTFENDRSPPITKRSRSAGAPLGTLMPGNAVPGPPS